MNTCPCTFSDQGKEVPCEVIHDYGKHSYVAVLNSTRHNGKTDWSNTDRYGSTLLVNNKNLTHHERH